MEINRPKIVIAGAGGGKTHQMINEILKIIPQLKCNPEKFCAIVTYTNSATEEIKNRIINLVGIPSNLHISTTHSFLTKFIIEPYSHLFGYLPIDKNYIDKIILQFKVKNAFAGKNICIKKATELSIQKGLIIYDKILETSFHLIGKKEVACQVSNRLSYIFVDEYQDMRMYQHLIFQTIISQGKTNFYCIGDPLQSIFNFTYSQSQLSKEPKPKNFRNSPILELNHSDGYDKETININNRSSNNIIALINHYNNILGYNQELPKGKVCNQIPLYFICGETKFEILSKYENLISNHQLQKDGTKMFSLLIAENWNLFEDVTEITTINNENSSSKTLFNECSRIVLGSLGINRKAVLDLLPINDKREKFLHFRQFCFSILKDIRNPEINVTNDYILNQFDRTFKINFRDTTNKNIDISKSIEKLKVVSKIANNDRYCSSIHTSKGLEATSVLVLARTNKQLLKWLNFENVTHDTDDDYRLGYVAFSRARELLCLTSIEKPTDDTIGLIKKLKFEIV